MLNLGCGQYLRNPFFPGFWGQKWGCGLCILADYTRLYTVTNPGTMQYLYNHTDEQTAVFVIADAKFQRFI